MNNLTVFVGRQPIFDRNGNIYAYELLYRNSDTNHFPNINPEDATIELIINTFLTIGIDRLVGKTRSFINFSGKLLAQDIFKQLDPNIVVIEVLEETEITPTFIARLTSLKQAGYKIVLDDFVWRPMCELSHQLFKLVSIVKVDFLNTTSIERRKIETLIKDYSHITLLAEKVETKKQYDEAKRSGYLLFQGYYMARPEIIKSKDIPLNYVLHFHLIQKFNETEPNVDQISEIMSRDISLSYKLLRYINSLAFGIPNKVSSIKQAIMLMGLNEAKRWLKILLLRDIGTGSGRGREKALIDQSLVRAKICELLAKHTNQSNPDEFFLTGMFSLIHIIMKSDMKDILPQLSLSNKISQTLLGEETSISPYVRLSEALEKLELESIKKYAEIIGVSEVELSNISAQAHGWATMFD